MPDSIAVAAFVIGIALVLAAIIGKEMKIVDTQIPPLAGRTRLVVGILGVALLIYGIRESKGLDRGSDSQATPAIAQNMPAGDSSSTAARIPSASAILLKESVALPPGYAGNIRSAKTSFGCGVLQDVVSSNDQLSVCGEMQALPEEWHTRVKRVNVDCATLTSDRIIVQVWTGTDYSGDRWEYSFGCPSLPAQTSP